MSTVKEVSLLASGDEVISRVVVSVENGVIFVCKREEFELAERESREPVCIGFRKEYVLKDKKGGSLQS
jgi:hypothetical protein